MNVPLPTHTAPTPPAAADDEMRRRLLLAAEDRPLMAAVYLAPGDPYRVQLVRGLLQAGLLEAVPRGCGCDLHLTRAGLCALRAGVYG